MSSSGCPNAHHSPEAPTVGGRCLASRRCGPGPRDGRPSSCPCPPPVCVRVLSWMGWGPHRDPVSPRHSTCAGTSVSGSGPRGPAPSGLCDRTAGRHTAGLRRVRLSRCTTPEASEPRPPSRAESTARFRAWALPSGKHQTSAQQTARPPAASRPPGSGLWGPCPNTPAPCLAEAPAATGSPSPGASGRGVLSPGGPTARLSALGEPRLGQGPRLHRRVQPPPRSETAGAEGPVAPEVVLRVPRGEGWALALGGAVLYPKASPCLGVPQWVQSPLHGRGAEFPTAGPRTRDGAWLTAVPVRAACVPAPSRPFRPLVPRTQNQTLQSETTGAVGLGPPRPSASSCRAPGAR